VFTPIYILSRSFRYRKVPSGVTVFFFIILVYWPSSSPPCILHGPALRNIFLAIYADLLFFGEVAWTKSGFFRVLSDIPPCMFSVDGQSFPAETDFFQLGAGSFLLCRSGK